jgi:hypothetical protein
MRGHGKNREQLLNDEMGKFFQNPHISSHFLTSGTAKPLVLPVPGAKAGPGSLSIPGQK